MSREDPRVSDQLSGPALRALDAFEREAARVFPGLGAPAAGDAALIASLADRAVSSAAPVAAAAVGKSSPLAWLAGGIGVAVVTAVVVWSWPDDPPPAAPTVRGVHDVAPEPPAPSEPPSPPPADAVPATVQPEPSPAPAVEAGSGRPRGSRSSASKAAASPGPAPASARELLRAANTLRREGEWSRARDAYRVLTQRFPDSREDLIGRVSLGKLELEYLGDPAAALRHFDAYLGAQPRGNLAVEAMVGRATALQRMGRTANEKAAWAELVARFPDSAWADRARERLAALGG